MLNTLEIWAVSDAMQPDCFASNISKITVNWTPDERVIKQLLTTWFSSILELKLLFYINSLNNIILFNRTVILKTKPVPVARCYGSTEYWRPSSRLDAWWHASELCYVADVLHADNQRQTSIRPHAFIKCPYESSLLAVHWQPVAPCTHISSGQSINAALYQRRAPYMHCPVNLK